MLNRFEKDQSCPICRSNLGNQQNFNNQKWEYVDLNEDIQKVQKNTLNLAVELIMKQEMLNNVREGLLSKKIVLSL